VATDNNASLLLLRLQKSRELVRLLEDRNRTLLNPSGLNLLHPSSKAWLYLELEYY
jgi:hypothetical protein